MSAKRGCPQKNCGMGYVKIYFFSMAIPYMILGNGGTPTKSILSRAHLSSNTKIFVKFKAWTYAFLSVVRYVNHIICIFMNINKNIKKRVKIIKN